ncbi:serine hydrolase [Bacteroides sp. 519]|uniref:serine hydrolase domain-containing protein n=1 Tax=Bacteroides sp. 519 TaxID=2302937 RepID=UPI0013CFCE9B|nr:serine hydrolase domain-containing protein [Bacteroides sp. 519]NDV58783.1 class A beta-lactamase-related serine hydrolase [Bacteroides sp. 519]
MQKYNFLVLLLLLQYSVAAQDFSVIDAYFSEKVADKKLAGAITLVVQDGEILHFTPYGYMNVEQSIPMDKNTIIPIASMTKVITSIGILILQEEGKLSIDNPIEKYLPQFRNLKVYTNSNTSETEDLSTKSTIRHLLNHTSGIVYSGGNTLTDKLYTEAGFREWNRPLPEFIDKITGIPLAFQPETKWQYGYSHDVLGYLIEVVSGQTLDCFLKERLFIPLGMNDTDFYVPKEKTDRQSCLYLYKDSILQQNDASIYHHLPVALSGGGGWWDSYGGAVSTVSDFYLLADWLLNYENDIHPDILHSNSLKGMLSNQIDELQAFRHYKYGLGIGIVEDAAGETKEVFWSGSPYNTYFWVNYERKEIGILFTNTAPYGHLDVMNKFKNMAEELQEITTNK